MYSLFRALPLILIFVLLMCYTTNDVLAHRAFGVFYPASEANRITEEEIGQLKNAGMTWVMLQERLDESKRTALREAGLSLLILVPEYFPVPWRLRNADNRYVERSDSLMRHYRNDPYVKGFGLFAFGKWQNEALPDRLRQLAEPYLDDRFLFTVDLRPFSGEALYPFDGTLIQTRSAEHLQTQLAQDPRLAGILYVPEKRDLDVRDFREILDVMENRRNLPIFFHRDLFFYDSTTDARISDSELGQMTDFYYQISDARIAAPAPDSQDYALNWSVLLLFLLWAGYTGYYRLNPLYRKSVYRFFLNYTFFVKDVLMQRIRFPVDAAVLFLLSCVISGIMGFASAHMFFDSVSRKALIHYIPFVPLDWSHPAVFFAIFFMITALFIAIQIIWLRIANRHHAKTWQIATLLLWPQHLNIVIVSVGVMLLRSYPSVIVVSVMFLIFWSITFISFFTTAYNMRRIYPTSPLYMASTYALFMLISTIFISWMIFGMDFFAAWNLAVSLSTF